MKRWKWQGVNDLRAALCWPWDQTLGGKYGAQNDNGWVQLARSPGSGRHFVHQADYAKGQR